MPRDSNKDSAVVFYKGYINMLKRIFTRLPIAYYPYKKFMHKHKCIFIHIPKNAGSSVLSLFNDSGGRKHAKWFDFYESNDFFFKRYHKFAIVREPLERLYSAYQYSVSGGNQSVTDLALMDNINQQCDSFNSFITSILSYDFIMIQPLFQPQYLYLFDRQLNSQVDSILRYENLQIEWKEIALSQNFPRQIPWSNRSTSSEKFLAVTEKSANKVKELYHLDYKLLNYSIPGNISVNGKS